MLYLILPPIIVVVSLAVLIAFVSRKVATISPEELTRREMRGSEVASNSARERRMAKISHGLLAFLEKFLQWIKIVFLKFHNKVDALFRAIREKRRAIKSAKPEKAMFTELVDSVPEEKEKEEVVVSDYAPEVQPTFIRDKFDFNELKKDSGKKEKTRSLIFEVEEKLIRPMISEKVVTPDSKPEIKSKLEELLIERIASDPRDIEAYERLGDYYMERKSFEDSRECFKIVLRMSPANRRAKMKMRRLERILGK